MKRISYIRNPLCHLYNVADGESFYIGIMLRAEDSDSLCRYGLDKEGWVIPFPCGCATKRNFDGEEVPIKDEPKEWRSIEKYFDILDWHGNPHDGYCYQDRLCYRRRFVAPWELYLFRKGNLIISEKLYRKDDCTSKIKNYMNIFLEIFSRFEVFDKDKELIVPKVEIRRVPWQILPPGEAISSAVGKIIKDDRIVNKTYKAVTTRRQEAIIELNPDCCYMGLDSFKGYIVYCFNNLNLYLFESLMPNNATYAFIGEWRNVSKLSKKEILSGGFADKRFIHCKYWEKNIFEYFEEIKYER